MLELATNTITLHLLASTGEDDWELEVSADTFADLKSNLMRELKKQRMFALERAFGAEV